MSLPSRLLCALYSLTSLWLAWYSVRQYQYGGSAWSVPLFAVASIVPVIAVVRESVLADEHRTIAVLRRQKGRCTTNRDELCEAIACAELNAACCERWWTSRATDHDPTCPHQRRSNAA
ncbi:hypothetical protein ACFYO2_19550 [Streptomyces sp. NPDC006602]|uniref:hypothetical protein n=1 Tax=Streptomyces sp. NPDC006602 TaxID=3364751 RepID=UPI00369DD628